MSVSHIAAMFDRISPKYDALNHLLSLNIDKVWRRKTAKAVSRNYPKTILDLATGTADLAIAIARRNPQAQIIGMDISEKMLEIGQKKVKKLGLGKQIELRLGDAAHLPFEDGSFDAVTVAFGVRNFEDFLRLHINPYCRADLPVSFVGSVAWHFQEQLREAAENLNFHIGTILKTPMAGLIRYHSQS